MERDFMWILIAIVQLIVIIILRREKNKLADCLTNLLLHPGLEDEFLRGLQSEPQNERLAKINKKYAIGLTNSLLIAKKLGVDEQSKSIND